MSNEANKNQLHNEEIVAKSMNGMGVLILNIALIIAGLAAFIHGINLFNTGYGKGILLIIVGGSYSFVIGPIIFAGLKVLKPNEALVLTLFGRYYGTLKGEGFFFVNPFVSAVNTGSKDTTSGKLGIEQKKSGGTEVTLAAKADKKISLKTMTLNNEKQKVNDQLGNPIIIGIVVIWRVVNTAKAVFNVDNYTEFLSIQTDSALRNVVRAYPYDVSNDDNEKSLRGSSQEVTEKLKAEIQSNVEIAG